MKNFYDDRGGCFEDEDGDMEEMSEGDGLDLFVLGLNRKILEMTIDLVKKGWIWRFRSLDSKLKIIEATYKKLSSLMIAE